MDLLRLKQFVQLADEMHFGRAAARLRLSQPALSRSMQRLEREVGTPLIDRSRRQISLTPAGAAFVTEARGSLAKLDLARAIANRTASGEIGTIRIGVTPTALHRGLLRGVRAFRREWPTITLSISHLMNQHIVDALEEGRIDLGFFFPALPLAGRERIEVQILDRSFHMAAIPSAWPQARRKRLKLRDLAPLPLVFTSRGAPHIHSALVAACRAEGFMPNIVQEVDDAGSSHTLVSCEVGAAFVHPFAMLRKVEGVSFLSIVDLPKQLRVDFAMAWVPRGISDALRALINCVRYSARA
jgi:DNA-binding transcriptional LysR family regulator